MALIGSSLRLSLYDRAGLLQSVAIDIHKNPQAFLRVLCGFAFGDQATLGFDPTVTEPDENGTRSITVRGTKYDIEKVVHMDNTLRGRGTIILQVRSGPESTSIIKDSWIDVSRPEKEHEILEKAKDVEGIVHMIDFERVEINGIVDSTKIIRDKLGVATKMGRQADREPETREHYRLVLKESGVSLRHFATRRELLSVLIDAVEGE
ncbi:hypothetical protein PUNSTDRAFT_133682 [Punctularia strigosozonata HHB-11173 SS5]|uniref:uncharacterized protein n=1 Tax=Punctularia strigosozonata (strain HHB-11173) TaxID=741275 RepID=UPI00044178A9|nr:uncharacterized protein PUNSTDRAFT_133682 [Punctularia strigosozonata HHB-11173 SS5]EIN09909.1 hypothetical protein PUNSTDRAFT_133682 [Punctularia strigosozonata HHB-11173 SS5]